MTTLLDSAGEPTAVFVYGTLKRGERRGGQWPRRPLLVERATVRGELHDLGPYPALLPGQQLVLGELWHFRPADIPPTLATLDEIEGFAQHDEDLYVRRIVESWTANGQQHLAFTYFYARSSDLSLESRVVPSTNGVCCWHRRTTRPSS
jgi:gamma-glutamylcyclotransferase (GGCT)/AIG2-like uncharacterized protein YtfP